METLDLRYALYDLDGNRKPAIAVDELVMAVQVEMIEREEDRRAGLCSLLAAGRVVAGWTKRPQPPQAAVSPMPSRSRRTLRCALAGSWASSRRRGHCSSDS